MRVIFADCEVIYTGRGDTTLPRHTRMILIKDDGSVSINGYSKVKPLNYMGPKSVFNEEIVDNTRIWTFDSAKENLTITLFEIYQETDFDLGEDGPELIRDGTEAQLQDWLAENVVTVNPDLRFLKKEFLTEAGPVDILAFNEATQTHVLIEVKRVATTAAVYQIKRYLEAFPYENKEGMIIALDVRPKTQVLAGKKDIAWTEVSPELRCQ